MTNTNGVSAKNGLMWSVLRIFLGEGTKPILLVTVHDVPASLGQPEGRDHRLEKEEGLVGSVLIICSSSSSVILPLEASAVSTGSTNFMQASKIGR